MAKDKDKAKAASKARAAAAGPLPTAGTYPTKAAAIAASQARGNAVRATRPPVKSTTARKATVATAKKAAASPTPRDNFLYMRPTVAAQKAATGKAGAKVIARALSEARGNVAGPRPTAPKYATREEGIAASKARGAAARAAKAAAASAPAKKAGARTPSRSTSRDLQAAVNKMGKFKTTEADPKGWASIAKALGDAGDVNFKAYATGRPGTSEARKYVKAKQAKASKSGRGAR
jgi:hypothetical protein